ncbi:hypothetical protein FQN52_008868 [Onygenales sp. PD_12]|nr:hypothetical protein FQN52_008868 [Onygenales sp. PD_12]
MAAPVDPVVVYLPTTHRIWQEKPFFFLRRLLLLVRETSSLKEFLSCALVCQNWYREALGLLEAIVVLRNENLDRFLTSARLRGPDSYLIQSLTLHLEIPPSGSLATTSSPWPIARLLHTLSGVISQAMLSLQFFSLRIDDLPLGLCNTDLGGDEIIAEPSFPATVLIALLEALPVTCHSVELDTSGFEVYADGEHLCPEIAKRLRWLHHLRLRVRRLCPKLIDMPAKEACYDCPDEMSLPCPYLRSLTINMELSKLIQGGVTRCSPRPRHPHEDKINPSDLQVELSHYLRLGQKTRHCFPVAHTIEICGPIQVQVQPFYCLRNTNILHQKTFMSTYIPLPSYSDGTWKKNTHRAIRCWTGRETVAPWTQAREAYEAAKWRNSSEGARFPPTHIPRFRVFLGLENYAPINLDHLDFYPSSTLPNHESSIILYLTQNMKQADADERAKRKKVPQLVNIHEEIGRIDKSGLLMQVYHTLWPIPTYVFPDPLPDKWYRDHNLHEQDVLWMGRESLKMEMGGGVG